MVGFSSRWGCEHSVEHPVLKPEQGWGLAFVVFSGVWGCDWDAFAAVWGPDWGSQNVIGNVIGIPIVFGDVIGWPMGAPRRLPNNSKAWRGKGGALPRGPWLPLQRRKPRRRP